MIFILDRDENIVGVLSNNSPRSCPYYKDTHSVNLDTGENNYTFSIPGTHEMAEKIESNGFILVKDLDEKMQMFQIKDISDTGSSDGNEKTIYGEHIVISELLTNVVRPTKLKSVTLEYAVNYILGESDWKIGQTDSNTSQDVEFEDYITVLEALRQVAEAFDAETSYEVIYEHGKVQEKLVHCAERVGQDTYKVFTYTKDLEEVTRKENTDNLVTALIAVGKGDSEDDSQLTLVGFESLGNDITTARGNDYIESKEALERFGRNGKHLFGVFKDDKATNQVELFNHAVAELRKVSKPSITYECKVALLERIEGWEAEKVRIGDKVRVYDYSFRPALLVEARVIELTRSYSDMEQDSIVLGDYKPLQINGLQAIQKLQSKIMQKEEAWSEKIYRVDVVSEQGTLYKGTLNSRLTATVYEGNTNITSKLSPSQFKWFRYSGDTTADTNWNTNVGKGVKSVTVTNTDIYGSTTFRCEVTI